MMHPSPPECDPQDLVAALALVALVLKVDRGRLTEDDGMETMPQWDSLKVMLLASMIEVERGITLDNDEIEQLTTVRAVAQVLARHGPG